MCACVCLCVCRLVENTKKDGLVDMTQAYGKIINSIREAEEAARTADRAAQDALKVRDCPSLSVSVCLFACELT